MKSKLSKKNLWENESLLEEDIIVKQEHFRPTWLPFISGIIFCTLIWVIFLLLCFDYIPNGGYGDCGSETTENDLCYCEKIQKGSVIKCPVNTLSAASFSVQGLLILASLGRSYFIPKVLNRMTTNIYYPVIYGCLAIFMGPGSAMFHATQSYVGGFLDVFSMYIWLGFIAIYNIQRMFRMKNWITIMMYVGLILFLSIGDIFLRGVVMFTVLWFITVTTEIMVYCSSIKPVSWEAYKWFLGSLVMFSIAWIIWFFSRTGQFLCNPNSIIQGHAFWHILSSFCIPFLYLYLQRAPDPSPMFVDLWKKKLTFF